MLKNMDKKTKIILVAVGGMTALGIIGSIGGGESETTAVAPITTQAPVPVTPSAKQVPVPVTPITKQAPVPAVPIPEPTIAQDTTPTEDNAVYAQRIYDAWLTSRGATTQLEVLEQSPGNPQGYLVSAESPVVGTVVFTAQLTKDDVTKDELKATAMAVLQLVGFDDETVDRIEIVTADSLLRGVANRRDSPLLNL